MPSMWPAMMQTHDLHERDLDRVGVFEDWQVDGDVAAARAGVFLAIEIDLDALFVVALVEVAESVAAEGGRSALCAVDLDVLTAIWEIWHGGLLPPPPWSTGILGLTGFCELNSCSQ